MPLRLRPRRLPRGDAPRRDYAHADAEPGLFLYLRLSKRGAGGQADSIAQQRLDLTALLESQGRKPTRATRLLPESPVDGELRRGVWKPAINNLTHTARYQDNVVVGACED